MNDDKKLPADSEMQEAVERVETPITKRKVAKLKSSPIGAQLCSE
jgi:hypothetical protein